MSVAPWRGWLPALLTASAVAAASWLLSGFAFYIGNALDATVLLQALGYFALASLLLALVLTLLFRLGALGSYASAALASAGAAIGASLIAAGLQLANVPLGPADALGYLLGSLFGVSLVFCLATVLATVLWAPRLLARLRAWRPPARHRPRPVALVRLPAANLAEGELTHLERSPVDTELALEQWDNYCATLISEGFDLVELPVAAELADSVFVEDAVLFFDELVVLGRSGAESRRGELAAIEEYLAGQRGLRIERIVEPGTLDGGDVLRVGETVYVGSSSRTNGAGIQQLRELLRPRGLRVVAVPVEHALHLKTAVTALPDGSLVGDPELIDARALPGLLPVPERAGASVLPIDEATVLCSVAAPRTAELLSRLGYRVIAIDVSEFEKLEGGVTCLSARWDKSSPKARLDG